MESQPKSSTLTHSLRSMWTLVVSHSNSPSNPLKSNQSNSSLKSLMLTRIIKMTINFRCPLTVEMTPFTWEQSTWDHQRASQLVSSSILDLSTWPSQVPSAMIKPLVILNLRSMTQYQDLLSKEINWTKGVSPQHMTCTSLIPIKFCRRPHQNWLTAQPSFKGLSGRIMHAFNLSLPERIPV